MNSILLDLIHDYVGRVNYILLLFASKFEKELQLTSLIEARRIGKIPQRGLLNRRCIYYFHGLGCRVKLSDCEVDFDFGPCGITGGFDTYKLKKYVDSLPKDSEYKFLIEQKLFDSLFEELIAEKMIYKPEFQTTAHLYYLNYREVFAKQAERTAF